MEQERKVTSTSIEEGKNIAIIAYITVFGLIIAFVMNNDKHNGFASYHIRQSLGLCVCGVVVWIVGMVPLIGWAISIIAFFVMVFMWIMGLMNAINGKQKPVPILGDNFDEWFEGIK